MCGIIGYVGQKEASPILLKGIKRLEYRGYDSVMSLKTSYNFFSKKKRFSYKLKALDNTKMNFPKNFEDIPKGSLCMDILKFIKFKNYYCRVNPSFQKRFQEKISNHSEFGRKVETSYATINRMVNVKDYWMNFEKLLRLSQIMGIEKEEVFSNINSIKTHNSFPIAFKVGNLISPQLFRILGHILSDGGIHVIKKEGKYRAFYVNNEHELLNSFTNDITFLFNDIKLYSRERENHGDEIWLPTTVGYLFYQMLNYGQNTEKRVPKFILDIDDEELVGKFLQAVFDDEGSISVDKYMVVISLGNENLLKDIKFLLEKIDVETNNIFKVVPKNRSIMFRFSITSKENILNFARKVGFLHPLKNKKLSDLVNKYSKVI